MRAIIITAYLNYDWNIRIKYLKIYLEQNGYEVLIITSDFDHRNKKKYKNSEAILVHVPKYYKNLSIKRMWSHYVFSEKAVRTVKEMKADLVYAITPPNFLFYFLKKLKTEQPTVKIICETEDLWPEALPIDDKKKKLVNPLLSMWSSIRDKNLSSADALVFECGRFEKKIARKLNEAILYKTIYLTRDDTFSGDMTQSIDDGELGFLYLGSLNNLVDIDFIIEMLKYASIKRNIIFHVIGNGEQTEDLLKKCDINKIKYINHGPIYNDHDKEQIFSRCHFAFNIMKNTTYVGVTMKSLEYFHYGIPVINNIPGDTSAIVEKRNCGINVTQKNYKNKINDLYSKTKNEYKFMKINARKTFISFFSDNSYYQAFDNLLKRMN